MTVKIALRPYPEHGNPARAANKLTDTELAPEAIDANFARNLSRIAKYLDENSLALANLRRHKQGESGELRIISDIGFNELGNVVDTGRPFTSSGAPVFQYLPPKKGAVTIRDNVPSIFVMHSFGGLFDNSKLSKRAVKSIAVEPATGFNPAKYSNGIRTLVTRPNQKSIHHIVSRRGDLTNSAGWDLKARHGGGPQALAARAGVNTASIGIEQEEYYIRHGNERSIRAIENRVPYTEEQYTVIAFILKKYITWTNRSEVLRWLGPGVGAIQAVKAGEIGMVNHKPFDNKHADPSAEYNLFQGYRLGDPLPAHLQGESRRYAKRFELFFGDVAPGTLISAWDRIFDKVARIRNFKLATEVFDQTLAGDRIDIEIPAATGTHVAGAANLAARDRLAQMSRSQRMQGTSRSNFYSRAQTHNAALGVAVSEHTSRLREANQQASAQIAVVTDALGFDFASAQWVANDTVNKIKSDDG